MIRYIWAFSFLSLILWIGFIWHNSSEDAGESSQRSQAIVETINEFLEPGHQVTEHMVRKAAHFTEYFVEGVLAVIHARLLLGMLQPESGRRKRASKSFMGRLSYLALAGFGVFTAVADETIQIFQDGRGPSVLDVLLDVAGFCVGCVLCHGIWGLPKLWKA